jgi:hypothetical protein
MVETENVTLILFISFLLSRTISTGIHADPDPKPVPVPVQGENTVLVL